MEHTDPTDQNDTTDSQRGATALIVEFVDQVFKPDPAGVFTIGRRGDLVIDADNMYLHRRLLLLSVTAGLWWLSNVGERIAASVCDSNGRMDAWLAPGARMPLVFPRTEICFSAGQTTYQVDVVLSDPPYVPLPEPLLAYGGTTVGRTSFTDHQLELIVALAEPTLRRRSAGGTSLPTLVEVGDRLDWTSAQVNRTLDRICEKLTASGVKGLHRSVRGRNAVDRRARLVEYALAARIVSFSDLRRLDRRRHGG